MTVHAMRVEQYYNAIVGRGRTRVAPSMREVRRELRRQAVSELWGLDG